MAWQETPASTLCSIHIKETKCGHDIYLYEPQLVTDAIHDVVKCGSNLAAAGALSAAVDAGEASPSISAFGT